MHTKAWENWTVAQDHSGSAYMESRGRCLFTTEYLPVLFGANLLLQLSLLPFQLAEPLLLRQQLVVAEVQRRHVFLQGPLLFVNVSNLRLTVLVTVRRWHQRQSLIRERWVHCAGRPATERVSFFFFTFICCSSWRFCSASTVMVRYWEVGIEELVVLILWE